MKADSHEQDSQLKEIDVTAGNITVNAPIPVGEDSYPYGATIAPDGAVTALPASVVPGGDFAVDSSDDPAVEIDDPTVPLAGGPGVFGQVRPGCSAPTPWTWPV